MPPHPDERGYEEAARKAMDAQKPFYQKQLGREKEARDKQSTNFYQTMIKREQQWKREQDRQEYWRSVLEREEEEKQKYWKT
jgi:hypothetical protein